MIAERPQVVQVAELVGKDETARFADEDVVAARQALALHDIPYSEDKSTEVEFRGETLSAEVLGIQGIGRLLCKRMLATHKYARDEFKFEGTSRDRRVWSGTPAAQTLAANRVR